MHYCQLLTYKKTKDNESLFNEKKSVNEKTKDLMKRKKLTT